MSREKSFQARAEEPLGTDFHQTISKLSSACWVLIKHKKYFALLCPIGEQQLLCQECVLVPGGGVCVCVWGVLQDILGGDVPLGPWNP